MAQHFLLSSAAKTLSLSAVARLSDEEALESFKTIRWADNGGEPYCPYCGCAALYHYRTRPLWKCKSCEKQFSVTAGTIFASRKKPIRDYLLAIAIFANGAKGISALQLSRDILCDYKTAFVLAHKLREAMASEMDGQEIGGVSEVDGGYFGGHIKPTNHLKNRKDRRLAENQNGKRQCVVIMRERGGRALPFVVSSEEAAVPIIRAKVRPGTTIHADEASAWDTLHAHYDTKRIHHKTAFSDGGACTNLAESYFSRLRRAEIGTHHHLSGQYLSGYANEFAWRENNRRTSNGEQYLALTRLALAQPVSRQWSGYWQRHTQIVAT